MREDLDLKKLEQILNQRRAVILSRIRVKSDQGPKVMNPDRADLAQDYFLRERNSALRDRMEDTLEQIESALQRMKEDSYGKCARCGKDISTPRLKALPYAEFCITCQKLLETTRR